MKTKAEELEKCLVSDKFSDEKLFERFNDNFFSKEEIDLSNEINALFGELSD